MNTHTKINLHIDRVIIDEAVHRAGPEAVRTALMEQVPTMLAAQGVSHHPQVTVGLSNQIVSQLNPQLSRPS